MYTRYWLAAAVAMVPTYAMAQTPEFEERLLNLERKLERLEREVQEKDARIRELEAGHTPAQQPVAATPAPPAAAVADVPPAAKSGRAAFAAAEPASNLDTASPMAPGRGFQLGKSALGTLNIGAYALFRATNQTPDKQDFTDHLGRVATVDTRRDMQFHRVMVHFRGWVFDPKFNYQLTTWTVNDTEQVRLIGSFSYLFSDYFALGGGVGPNAGTRSMMGSHPLWLGHDRVMADEYFRPGFTQGVWADGKITPTLRYKVVVGDNVSTLGVNAVEDTRALAYSGSLWWMPTTGEFGPQGAYGDFELHEEPATRFGISYITAPREDRAAQPSQNAPDTTQIRLGDSLLLFQANSLGEGVTVQQADFELVAMDLGFKYRGFFFQTEFFHRTLDQFLPTATSAPIPIDSIVDKGFYVQTAFYPIPKKLELYAATSQVYPDEDVGYDHSSEFLVGANWYWSGTRYQRMNFQVINVNRSPTSSTFGYYTGGHDGLTFTLDVSMLF